MNQKTKVLLLTKALLAKFLFTRVFFNGVLFTIASFTKVLFTRALFSYTRHVFRNIALSTVALSMLICLSLNANAENLKLQKFTVANNAEIQAVASKSEITRLAFDSNVIEIHALSEEIEYAINGKDIYLRLTAEKPVNFFVKTEDEMTYKLVLVADEIESTQIFIHNKGLGTKTLGSISSIDNTKLEYFNQVSPELKNRTANIIDITLSPTKYLGFDITSKYLNLISPIKDLKMQLVKSITGNMLLAEKIYLTNKGDKPLKMNLKDFATPEYLAIYLSATELLPKQECVLIRVLEN